MINPSTAQVVIIDDFHPFLLENLSQSNITYTYKPEISRNQVLECIYHHPIVAVRSKINFDKALIDALPNLKCIARGGAGMDNIDEAYAKSKGIELLNAPEGNRDAVAEHTIGLLLSMSKKIVQSHNEVVNFQWNREENRGWEINGKTVGIIGFGNTGSLLAKKLSGFDCQVITYDKYLDQISSEYARQVSLNELLSQSDIISFHVPLTSETQEMLNADLISKMKEGVVILNTSRGRVSKNTDVLNGIKSGKIKNYGCDVLENENFSDLSVDEKSLITQLISSNQVVITPHIAGWSRESYYKIAQVLSEKIKSFTIKAKII